MGATYKTLSVAGDMGAWIRKVIVDLPVEVGANDVDDASFGVYVERIDPETGEVALSREHHGDPVARPSKGYPTVEAAYVCDEAGRPADRGSHVAFDLVEERLSKRFDGNVMGTKRRIANYRITQLKALPGSEPGEKVVGLVFDECAGDIFPELEGWDTTGFGTFDGIDMHYALFSPDVQKVNARRTASPFGAKEPLPQKLPLIVWLHGAGEGGDDPFVTICGNKVTGLSSEHVQDVMGGAAYVLAPTCPTYWMDDGVTPIAQTNVSIYTKAVKACVDAVVASHDIDPDRIYVGGDSNGGFMAVRQIIDYPDFYAAAVPACSPFYSRNVTDEYLDRLKGQHIWFVHSDDDTIVDPTQTVLPIYHRLKDAGAADVHLTYYDHLEDLSGRYKDAEGRHSRYTGHLVWVPLYDDYPKTDLDGSRVMVDGRPVTVWQWCGMQRRGR